MVSWFVDVQKPSAELQQVKLGIWLSMWKYARQSQIANLFLCLCLSRKCF